MRKPPKEERLALQGKVQVGKTHFMAWASAVVLLFTACASVGPDYVPPSKPTPQSWHSELGQGLRNNSLDTETLARWWTTFDDPDLSRLINRAVENNLEVKEASSRVREARARRGVSEAGFYPALDAEASVTKRRSGGNTGKSETSTLYIGSFDAGWEIDIFGGVRRSVEAADADLRAAGEDLNDVLVSLLAEVALNYVELRTYQTRLDLAQANSKAQEETFDIASSRYQAGLGGELAVQQARYNLENTRSQIPTLRTGLEETLNRLAVLTAQAPGSLHDSLNQHRAIPVTPPSVAVGVPAETLRRRPDVRRAEYQLVAETARIGVAEADLYPKLRLAGSIGLEASKSVDFFDIAGHFWSFGPTISWNIFDAGAVRKNIEAQSAVREQVLFAYEAAVLGALEEVENTLTAYAQEILRRERLLDAVSAAQEATTLAEAQYTAGLMDFSDVLDAQRSLLSFQDQLAQSEGTVTTNLVRLYKALGGGWTSLSREGRE
jgi:multidrug efflux system outer membrane protein